LFGRQNQRDHGFQSDECTLRDLYPVALGEFEIHLFNLRKICVVPQWGQSLVFDGGIPIAEPDNTDHTMSVADLPMHFRQPEAGKQIAGEHSLSDPDDAAPTGPLKSDPGTEDNHSIQHTKMGSRDVLVFVLRPHAIPSGFWANLRNLHLCL